MFSRARAEEELACIQQTRDELTQLRDVVAERMPAVGKVEDRVEALPKQCDSTGVPTAYAERRCESVSAAMQATARALKTAESSLTDAVRHMNRLADVAEDSVRERTL